MTLSRRTLLAALPALAGALKAQRLTLPKTDSKTAAPAGLQKLGLREDRDALLYIPEQASKFSQAPLVVSLHGATRNADRGIDLLKSLADQHGFLVLAPASKGRTWDVLEDGFGPDIAFINQCLAKTMQMRNVDR